jgi:hypothetical protein
LNTLAIASGNGSAPHNGAFAREQLKLLQHFTAPLEQPGYIVPLVEWQHVQRGG